MKNSLIMHSNLVFVNKSKVLFLAFFSLFISASINAQLPLRIINGQIRRDDKTFGAFQFKKYTSFIDSLDKQLKVNPKDTTSLFYRAAIHLFSNDVLSKPFQREKGALENLLIAKAMVDSAVAFNMQDFRLKILRAQIYKNLLYRYSGDESWMFNSKQIAARRKKFNQYKELTNKYYDQLAEIDSNNAHEYQKLKSKSEYPI